MRSEAEKSHLTGIHLRHTRTYLKNAFWPNIFVGASFKILDIQQYASGLKLGSVSILNLI
jgi:hypothetical protein